MPTNNIISRTDSAALVPEDVSNRLLQGLQNQSAALQLMPHVPMSRAQQRMPVISALPLAYFVTGDTGLKQTTEVNWTNKYLDAQEIAAIVPIPEAVLDDTSYDVWGAVQPLLEQAAARTLDASVLFGTNKPSVWPTAIVTAAIAASNTVERGTAAAAAGGVAEDFNQLFGKVEADGFDVNGVASRTSMKSVVRGARDTTGQPLMDVANNQIMGERIAWVARGLWPSVATAEAIAGDWNQTMLGIRQDFTYKILDQAVITDTDGTIIYNLAQQDMVALRLVWRVAFQVANTINYEGANDSTQYPFAVLQNAS